ncbi:MAG: PQQ-dependent sugar dehydrogenase [Gemmatimonadetes bacterium]|nr:PQQ-dependent sugar dehydrogenase [Gemmatimonadota bacterium]
MFADKLGAARHLTVLPNGDVFVNVRAGGGGGESPLGTGKDGGLVVLRDADGDGHAEVQQKVAEANGTEVQVANGHVYVTNRNHVVRFPMVGDRPDAGKPDTVIMNMPVGGHTAYNFVVDERTLYLNVGSRTNSCQQQDRQNQVPGVDPCVELETRAGIWVFDAVRSRQTAADGQRFATGIRNAVSLTMNPVDRTLYVTQHGRDQLMQNWGFTAEQSAEWPAEELFRVTKGDDFGWPYCFYNPELKAKVLAPEYGGDGRRTDRCTDKKAPVFAFPGHWAPNATMFYTGSQFPAKYRGGAFIAFHGSWNRAPLPQGGFKVVFLPIKDGKAAAATFDVFADGFAGPGGTTTSEGLHRPTGLAQGPDGSLYVSDDAGGRIYKISYTGGR